MFSQDQISNLYKTRRMNLLRKITHGAVLITKGRSAPDHNLNDKNLDYLVGPVPDRTILLLIPIGVAIDFQKTRTGPEVSRGIKVKEILFVPIPPTPPVGVTNNQKYLTQLQTQSGCEVVKWVTEFSSTLSRALLREEVLWVNISYTPTLNRPIPPQLDLLNQIKERFLWIQIKNIAPIIHKLRWVKDEYEIECLKNAFQIHTEIYLKIMKAMRPGVNEAVAKAIYDYEIGIRDPLKVDSEWNDRYQSNIIVAAGTNCLKFHYMDNNCIIQENELVLIDAGVNYNGYSSDITRTFPANGKFTPRQKELYNIVLEAENAAIAMFKPGNTQRDAHYAAYEVFKKYGIEKHTYGNAGHAVGLNIHDANDWGVSDRPLESGCVIVIEPQIKILEEGIGIRIEDGVIVRENGPELLAGPPRTIEEIERLCMRD